LQQAGEDGVVILFGFNSGYLEFLLNMVHTLLQFLFSTTSLHSSTLSTSLLNFKTNYSMMNENIVQMILELRFLIILIMF
jgi:hypothetical protein